MPIHLSSEVQHDSTILTLEGIGVPPYSARGLSQTLTPIDESSQTRRTINGSLKDLSVSQFHKYRSTITGKDQDPPACSGVWPGQILTVECIAELAYRSDSSGTFVTEEREAVFNSRRTEGDFTFYRPILTMRVLKFSIDVDEWTRELSWSMELEEV